MATIGREKGTAEAAASSVRTPAKQPCTIPGKADGANLPERPATNLRLVPGFARISPVPFSRQATVRNVSIQCSPSPALIPISLVEATPDVKTEEVV